MGTNKRSYEEMDAGSAQNATSCTTIFDHFRAELDEHHDRRERVMKASKDITANSKKMVKQLGKPIIDKRIQGDVSRLMKTINDLFEGIAEDLMGLNAYRYQRNISGGIQEFMEAIMFQHYLEVQQVISYEEASRRLPAGILLTYEDYTLGLFDMTGELMRFAITSLASGGQNVGTATRGVLADMQRLRSELEVLNPTGSYALAKDFDAKLKVTKQSVEKVENAFYSINVRGKERPAGWTPDLSTARETEVESY